MACILLFLFRILLASHLFCNSSASNGFSLKLIYRDSPYSPLYKSNFSYLQAFQRDIKTSKIRASNLMSLRKFEMDSSNILQRDTLQLSLFFEEPLFTLEVGVGTPTTKARLVFDTAAPLTWMQCQPCNHCFTQDYPIFDPRKSTSFRRMQPNHTLAPWFNCKEPDSECSYYVVTRHGVYSYGILSIDSFSFPGTLKILKNVVFGCGTRQGRVADRGPNMITGLLGMGNYPTSLIHQLGDQVKHRFSYCLPSLKSSQTERSDLSFGEAAVIKGENVQTTPILKRRDGTLLEQSWYRLNLVGISVAGERLEIPSNFSEGCILDTGSPFSILEDKAYDAVVNAISSYFTSYRNVKRIKRSKYPKNVCYKCPKGFRNFPSMTLHFEGAGLEINGTSLFMFGRSRFLSNFICLQLLGKPMTNILGVYQQQNIRFLYDLGNKKLSFAPENC